MVVKEEVVLLGPPVSASSAGLRGSRGVPRGPSIRRQHQAMLSRVGNQTWSGRGHDGRLTADVSASSTDSLPGVVPLTPSPQHALRSIPAVLRQVPDDFRSLASPSAASRGVSALPSVSSVQSTLAASSIASRPGGGTGKGGSSRAPGMRTAVASPFAHFLSEAEARAAAPGPATTDGQQLLFEWLAFYSQEEQGFTSASIGAEIKLR